MRAGLFQVTLNADTNTTSDAVLVATAHDNVATYYAPDAKYVEVQG